MRNRKQRVYNPQRLHFCGLRGPLFAIFPLVFISLPLMWPKFGHMFLIVGIIYLKNLISGGELSVVT